MHALSSKMGDTLPQGSSDKRTVGRKGLRRGRAGRDHGTTANQSPFSAALADLSKRLANLEMERKQLRNIFQTMQNELITHNNNIWKWKLDQNELFNQVIINARTLTTMLGSSMGASELTQDPHHTTKASTNTNKREAWTLIRYLVLFEAVAVLLYLARHRLTSRLFGSRKQIPKTPLASTSHSLKTVYTLTRSLTVWHSITMISNPME